MVIVKESGGNLVDYIETTVLGKGGKHINVERAEKQESVQRISKKLREIVEFYSKETDAISGINVTDIDDLRQSIEALMALINRYPEFEMVKQAYCIDGPDDIDPNMWFVQIYVEGDDFALTDDYYKGGIKW